jgi:hypothetical protein
MRRALDLLPDLTKLTADDVAFTIERNEYQGTVTPQMHVRAVRAAS